MKVRWIPFVVFVVAALLPGLSVGQAGFGGPGTELDPIPTGQGEGGGFGGGGGGGGRAWSENYQSPRTLILTPGQTVDIKVTTTRPMVGSFGASSEIFDPRIEVRDAAGKVLAENDDRAPGNQSPFVRVFLPAAGEYTVVVRSFKDAAGGRVSVQSEIVPATFVTPGMAEPLDLRSAPGRPHALVFEAKKDVPLGVTLRGLDTSAGEIDEAQRPLLLLRGDGVTHLVHQLPEDGMVFLPVVLNSPRPAYAMIAPVRRQALPANGQLDASLAPGEIAEVTLPREQAGLWQVQVAGTPVDLLRGVFVNRSLIAGIDPGLTRNTLLPFVSNAGANVILANPVNQPVAAQLRANLFRKPVTAGTGPSTFNIFPGDFQVHTIPVESGDTIQYTVESQQFVLAASLHAPSGQLGFSHEDRARTGQLIGTWMTVMPGDLNLKVHAVGHGGGGAYRLRYVRRPPLMLAPRTWHRVGSSVQALRIRARAEQPFVIWIKSDLDRPIALFGPTGGRIFSNDLKSYVIRPVVNGDYTILPQVPGDTKIRWVPQDD